MRLPGYTVQRARGYARSGPVWQVESDEGRILVAKLMHGSCAIKGELRIQGCVQIVDTPKIEELSYALIMEPVSGIALAELPSIEQGEYESWMAQVEAAISAMHTAGWVHREIHATNILVALERATLIDLRPEASHRYCKALADKDWESFTQLCESLAATHALRCYQRGTKPGPVLPPVEAKLPQQFETDLAIMEADGISTAHIRQALVEAQAEEAKPSPMVERVSLKKRNRERKLPSLKIPTGRAGFLSQHWAKVVAAVCVLAGVAMVQNSWTSSAAKVEPPQSEPEVQAIAEPPKPAQQTETKDSDVLKEFARLVKTRDGIFEQGEVSSLKLVDIPGGKQMELDEGALGRMNELEMVYRGLQTIISDAQVLPSTRGDAVSIQARLELGEYRVCAKELVSQCEVVPAQPPRLVRIALVGDPLRIESVQQLEGE